MAELFVVVETYSTYHKDEKSKNYHLSQSNRAPKKLCNIFYRSPLCLRFLHLSHNTDPSIFMALSNRAGCLAST